MTFRIENLFQKGIQNGYVKAIEVVKHLIENYGMKTEKEIEKTALKDLYMEISESRFYITRSYVDETGNLCFELGEGI